MMYVKEGTSTRPGVLFYEENHGSVIATRVPVETEIAEHKPVFPFLFAVPERLRLIAEEPLREALMAELMSARWMWGRLQRGHELPVTRNH